MERLYRVEIRRDEDTGFYIAEVPTLSPCITFGETMQEAIEMVKEAIEGVVESRLENGYPVPDDTIELSSKSVQTVISLHSNTHYQLAV